MTLCKSKYIRIANKEQEARLDKLISFLNESGIGHYSMAEKVAGGQHYVQVIVDLKVSASDGEKHLHQ